ncbi:hypothetical protein CPB84DRAFT_1754796 [Gymnopilus junonius]|uniref:Uncharacterized protein n=1 Tax=Gymnopilus junonius TaxID=109634 RepID=A0A9P5N896_GYMJU|nr:hypothetical protein CPB84DRAFT_1754796 [Gymnopilus junonius]
MGTGYAPMQYGRMLPPPQTPKVEPVHPMPSIYSPVPASPDPGYYYPHSILGHSSSPKAHESSPDGLPMEGEGKEVKVNEKAKGKGKGKKKKDEKDELDGEADEKRGGCKPGVKNYRPEEQIKIAKANGFSERFNCSLKEKFDWLVKVALEKPTGTVAVDDDEDSEDSSEDSEDPTKGSVIELSDDEEATAVTVKDKIIKEEKNVVEAKGKKAEEVKAKAKAKDKKEDKSSLIIKGYKVTNPLEKKPPHVNSAALQASGVLETIGSFFSEDRVCKHDESHLMSSMQLTQLTSAQAEIHELCLHLDTLQDKLNQEICCADKAKGKEELMRELHDQAQKECEALHRQLDDSCGHDRHHQHHYLSDESSTESTAPVTSTSRYQLSHDHEGGMLMKLTPKKNVDGDVESVELTRA